MRKVIGIGETVLDIIFKNGKLFCKINKRIETVRSVEFFVIFSVTAFYFAVMSWGNTA